MQCGSIMSAVPPHAQRIASRAARIGVSVTGHQLLEVGQRDDGRNGLSVPSHDRSLVAVRGAADDLREPSPHSFSAYLAHARLLQTEWTVRIPQSVDVRIFLRDRG